MGNIWGAGMDLNKIQNFIICWFAAFFVQLLFYFYLFSTEITSIPDIGVFCYNCHIFIKMDIWVTVLIGDCIAIDTDDLVLRG
jgi:hypothetical protein